MKLKKANAVLALLTLLALFLHVGYNIFAYTAFYYNPTLTKALSIPFLVLFCLHAALGMGIVFFEGDSPRADLYGDQNKRTWLQRISAILMFPLLILHTHTFELLQAAAGVMPVAVWGLLISEGLFYATVLTHIATSLSNAFVTLGWLTNPKAKETLDKVVYVLNAVLFVGAIFSIGHGQLAMFLHT